MRTSQTTERRSAITLPCEQKKSLLLTAAFGLIISLLSPNHLSALTIPEIVAKAKPAILKVIAYDSEGKPLGFGTGFFISDDGRLVTNRHAIEGAKTISAETVSGASYLCEGVLIQPQDVDLVILKFKAKGVEKLSFGDSSKVTEGQKVVVIGNPEGLDGTISEGIVSAFRDQPARLIQITAPISPGSSGSPVLDETGQVIGIATLIYKEGQNLNFAIPADEVKRALTSIPSESQVSRLAQKQDANSQIGQVGGSIQAIEDLEKQHRDSEALQTVAEFLRNHQDNAKAWSLRARILSALNLADEAVEAQKTVLKLNPDNAGAWADMVFYVSQVAGSTPKPKGIEQEIRSSAEHALALGDDREMTWDLLVWACKAMGDSASAAKYETTRDNKISRGELNLRTRALTNLIPGDYARIDLDDYVSKHSLALTLESKDLAVKGGPSEIKLSVDAPIISVGHACLNIDVFPRKSKNGHWYISEYTKTKVLAPALWNPGLGVEMLPPKRGYQKAYLAVSPGLKKEQETAINEWIRQIIAEYPYSFASFSEWKPEKPDAVAIFCSVNHQSFANIPANGIFFTGLLPQAPVGGFRTEQNVDRDLQQSALLQICMQNALPGNWGCGGTMLTNDSNASVQVKPDCPTIYCALSFNDTLSSAEKQKAKNDAKTAFVKGLKDFNDELGLIAASVQN